MQKVGERRASRSYLKTIERLHGVITELYEEIHEDLGSDGWRDHVVSELVGEEEAVGTGHE